MEGITYSPNNTNHFSALGYQPAAVRRRSDFTKKKRRQRPRKLSLDEAIAFYEDEKGHWTGESRDSDGYPILSWKGRTIIVHRAKAELAGLPIQGKVVRHIDGNPLNVRLDNLRVGTQAENMADMVAHGRSKSPRPRFTAVEASEIARMHENGTSINEIALRKSRTRGAVRKLLKGLELTKQGTTESSSQGCLILH